MMIKLELLMVKCRLGKKVKNVVRNTLTKDQQIQLYNYLKKYQKVASDHMVIQEIIELKGFIEDATPEEQKKALEILMKKD